MIEISELIARERVLVGLRPAGKRQLLQELADEAGAACGLDAKLVFDLLLQREKLGTTGVGDGIAIPHARVPGLERMIGFFVRLARPVDFDALDEQPVDLVFLLLAPEAAGADHLRALARISRVLRDAALCAQLRHVRDPQRAFALLRGGHESHAA